MTDNNKETWEQLEKAIKDATEIKTPEMTVDLPHEQKLTFGNLKPNTIVEIATWRGVGAPDQDSVRMLIGASLQPTDDTPEVVGQIVPELEGPVIPQSKEVIAAEEKAALAPSAPATHQPKRFAPSGPAETEYQKIHPELSWLLVREAQKLGITPFKQELSRKQMKAAKMKRPAKFGWLVSVGTLLSISLIIGGLNVTGVLAFDHPEVGPELPFGNATSSLVAIVPGGEPAAGDLAMATIENERNLVRVDAVSGDTFSIATMAGSMDVGMDVIDGKVSFIIPFIGVLWTLIGQ
jgi:hypothetical protein